MDPLFKKASADFDEGGAKGLLLNHLAINTSGRIVFDSSDVAGDGNAKEAAGEDPDQQSEPEPAEVAHEENMEIDIAPLANRFLPDLERLEQQDICPSLKNFDLGDPHGSLDFSFLKSHEEGPHDRRDMADPSGIMLDDDNAVGFDDDDDASLAGFDLDGEAGFGDGGEVWAREAALEPMLRVQRGDGDHGEEEAEADAYAISLSHQPSNHENILSYFDNALQKNWAGPEHWKIRKIKDHAATNAPATKQRKEKEPFEIDFAAPLESPTAELIYAQASSNSVISLPKTQWRAKGRNLLPDDKHFNSRQLLRLFLKPKARMGAKRLKALNRRREDDGNGEMDEAFWASHKREDAEDGGGAGTYDANFFADDDGLAFPNDSGLAGDDDDDDNLPFADAQEMLAPSVDGAPGSSGGEAGGVSGLPTLLNSMSGSGAGGFGSQLVTQGGRRARPDYVAYARVAKKVDVRRLKHEMWKGMGERLIATTDWGDREEQQPTPRPKSSEATDETKGSETMRFTQIMNSLKTVYPKESLRDISTSFGFICLLHLANEKGLVLQGGDEIGGGQVAALEEIYVRKDAAAVVEDGVAM